MSDLSINNVSGGGYTPGYVGGGKKEPEPETQQEPQAVAPEPKPQVSSEDVMKFLAANSAVFVGAVGNTNGVQEAELDPEIISRIEDSVDAWKMIEDVVRQEFSYLPEEQLQALFLSIMNELMEK